MNPPGVPSLPTLKSDPRLREELKFRLAIVAELLVAGWPRREIVRRCQKEFVVSRRTAQRYLLKAQKHLARLGSKETLAFTRQLAQDRRNFLFGQISQVLQELNPRDARHWPHLVSLTQTAARLIDQQESSAERRAEDGQLGVTQQVTAEQLIARALLVSRSHSGQPQPAVAVAGRPLPSAAAAPALPPPESLSAKDLQPKPPLSQRVANVSKMSQSVAAAALPPASI